MQSVKLPNDYLPVLVGNAEGLYILFPSEHSLHCFELLCYDSHCPL